MDGDNTSAGGKRSRKQTSFFEVKEVHIKKAAVVEGAGIKLADNPHFCQELERVKGDSDVCKALHSLLFGVVGKKLEIKKNLRAFSGLPAGASKEEKKAKILDRKKVWTMSLIKEALGLFGLEKAGDKEVVVTRLVDYIAEPTYTKSASAPGSGKKRKSVGKGGKKSSKRSKKSSEKKKVAPSSYILFCKDSRAALKADQPELSMIEQTKLLGSMWNALDEEAKKVLLMSVM